MPDKSFEELLAELDIEEEKDPEREPEPKGNQAFTQLRDAYKRREKENERLSKQLEEYRTRERTSALASAGLTESQQRVFLKAYDEVTPENIASYKSEVLGVKEAPPEEPEPLQQEAAPEPRTTGFAPSSGGMPVGKPMITRAEFDKMIKNPATRPEAVRALNEGRVQLNNETAYEVQVTDTAGLFRRNI